MEKNPIFAEFLGIITKQNRPYLGQMSRANNVNHFTTPINQFKPKASEEAH